MFMEGFCHGMHLDPSLLYLSHVIHVHGWGIGLCWRRWLYSPLWLLHLPRIIQCWFGRRGSTPTVCSLTVGWCLQAYKSCAKQILAPQWFWLPPYPTHTKVEVLSRGCMWVVAGKVERRWVGSSQWPTAELWYHILFWRRRSVLSKRMLNHP